MLQFLLICGVIQCVCMASLWANLITDMRHSIDGFMTEEWLKQLVLMALFTVSNIALFWMAADVI